MGRAATTAVLLSAAAAAGVAPPGARALAGTAPFVGGYALLNGPDGLAKLALLAADAATLPLTRVFLGFLSPTMVYVPGSETLAHTGLNLTAEGDGGFAAVKAGVGALRAAGVEVLLSIGGWDYNCFPYAYTRYSVAGYGTDTPNYWKIVEYCAGNVSAASPANEYCYTCEPPSAGDGPASFGVFPEPAYSATWRAAVAYVAAGGAGGAPKWDPSILPGSSWTDPATGVTTTVPGSPLPAQLQRDPYADVVHLAVELGASGVDVDYEEDWHADMTKAGSGPWTLEQTVYKFAAILKDVSLNVAALAPGLMISTASGAAGAWAGPWWGGNLKGVTLLAAQWYPDLLAQVAATGGVNVMTYDLSGDESHYECPVPAACSLDAQVAFYMATYAAAGIAANVGYETGTPAYPDPVENPAHALPLTVALLANITSTTQRASPGGFFWELFKVPTAAGEATPTQVAQAVCAVVLPGNARCTGSIPAFPPAAAPPAPPAEARAPPAGARAAIGNGTTGLSTYFANWAKYHQPPYAYEAADLAAIVPRLDEVNYAFIYFCPPPGTSPMPYWAVPPYGACTDATAFQLMSVEPSDAAFLSTIVGFKAVRPALKVLLSIGGWNFPSAYFSAMAATSATRAVFVASVKAWLAQYSLDGVDIDWEYPCSPARSDFVEISCGDFDTVPDAGGACPQDTANIVALFSDLRAGLGAGSRITVASQAAKPLEIEMAIAALDPLVDGFHLMTYDYAVSDVPGPLALSPNAPLYTPSAANAVAMSVNYTVSNCASRARLAAVQWSSLLWPRTAFSNTLSPVRPPPPPRRPRGGH